MFIDTPKALTWQFQRSKQKRRKLWTRKVSKGLRDVRKVNDQWVEEADLDVCGETLGAWQHPTGQHHWEALCNLKGMDEV